jgi:hypothetical protein
MRGASITGLGDDGFLFHGFWSSSDPIPVIVFCFGLVVPQVGMGGI